jgi:predicted GNAT superfamily acetyltransferase
VGESFGDLVPPHILKVAQRIGGVAAGAFDASGELAGFVFGITGMVDGAPTHWSDMLAVRPELRGRGIGRALKEHQRAVLAAAGVPEILWSFDPLVARNAHLNLARLGARVSEYVVEMYAGSDSPLHHGFGTDRLIVRWKTGGGSPEQLPSDPHDAPAVNVDRSGYPLPAPLLRRGATALRIEVPADIHAVAASELEAARSWRESTRAAFLAALDAHFRVCGFLPAPPGGNPSYLLVLRPPG